MFPENTLFRSTDTAAAARIDPKLRQLATALVNVNDIDTHNTAYALIGACRNINDAADNSGKTLIQMMALEIAKYFSDTQVTQLNLTVASFQLNLLANLFANGAIISSDFLANNTAMQLMHFEYEKIKAAIATQGGLVSGVFFKLPIRQQALFLIKYKFDEIVTAAQNMQQLKQQALAAASTDQISAPVIIMIYQPADLGVAMFLKHIAGFFKSTDYNTVCLEHPFATSLADRFAQYQALRTAGQIAPTAKSIAVISLLNFMLKSDYIAMGHSVAPNDKTSSEEAAAAAVVDLMFAKAYPGLLHIKPIMELGTGYKLIAEARRTNGKIIAVVNSEHVFAVLQQLKIAQIPTMTVAAFIDPKQFDLNKTTTGYRCTDKSFGSTLRYVINDMPTLTLSMQEADIPASLAEFTVAFAKQQADRLAKPQARMA